MADECVLENVVVVFDSVENHLVEDDGSVGVEIGAGDGQRASKGEFFVKEHYFMFLRFLKAVIYLVHN